MAMMDCPRCGFSQPKDRYCANCGLDTEAYQTRPPSIWKKLSTNPSVYIGALVLVIFGIVYFISKNNDSGPIEIDEFEAMSDQDRSRENPSSAGVFKGKSQSIQNSKGPVEPNESQTPNALAPPSREIPKLKTKDPNSSQVEEAASARPPAPTQLQISFYEVPQATLMNLIESSQVISEGAEYQILLHSSQKSALTELTNSRNLPGHKSYPLSNKNPSVEFLPTADSGSRFGLVARLGELTPLGLDLSFRVVLDLQEVPAKVDLLGQAPLTNENLILVIGVLPHLEGPSLSEDYGQGGPLSVITELDFQERLTEFVMAIGLKE